MKLFKRLGLESEQDDSNPSNVSKENEVVFYAKIGNPEGLNEADSQEEHEQLSATFSNGSRCRVRKTTDSEGSITYVYTFKVDTSDGDQDDINSNDEYNVEVDAQFFEGFRNVSENILTKRRYNFNSSSVKLTVGEGEDKRTLDIADVKYEVDVFIDDEGQLTDHCKIDLEVDTILDYLNANEPDIKDVKLNVSISHLPFEPSDVIIDVSASEEDRATINALWEKWAKDPLSDDGKE